ncbi:MAG: leucine-rich repeat domain-containing protein [Mycoplasmatales bacterium]
MKLKNIIMLIFVIIMILLILYLWKNHNKYIYNIEELKYYNVYNEEKYPEKNALVSSKTITLMNKEIVKFENKYNVSELRVDKKNSKELENISLYKKLQKVVIACPNMNYDNIQTDKLINLKKLNLLYCSDLIDLKFTSQLINLEVLDISSENENLKIGNMSGLEQLVNLKELYLPSNNILKIESLENLRNLKILYLPGNKIKEIKNVDNLINLRKLDLSNNNILKIEGLNNLSKLEELNLHSNNISKIEGLSNLDNLKSLYLFDNPIVRLESIEELKSIEKIYIDTENLESITRESYNYIIKNNVKLYRNNLEYQYFEEVNIQDLDIEII